MKKEIEVGVMERSKGLCEICHSPYMAQQHHIIGGRGKRKQHETVDSVIMLCWDHHHGTHGVHGREGKTLNVELKRNLQEKYFKQGHTEIEVRKMMGGKIY